MKSDAPPLQAPSTTPSLRARLRRLLKPPRLLALTRAGKFFVLMTLGVGFGAINTGNNLLFLMFGMMLSLILASGILSEAVLRHLTVRRRLPRRFVAGHPAPGRLIVRNQGWWPALSVEACEQNPRGVVGPAADTEVGPRTVPWWKFWRQQTDEHSRPVAAAYLMRVDAGLEERPPAHYELPHRGRYRLPGLQLRTRFPFSLFEKSRPFDAEAIITVFPAPITSGEWLGKLESSWGETARNQRGRGEEYFGLRDYRPGEDQRAIHWKSSARRGEPVVRENEARKRRALQIIFDNRAPDSNLRRWTPIFELGLRHLAGLIQELHAAGYQLSLITAEGQVTPEQGSDLDAFFEHLALLPLASPDAIGPQAPAVDEATETRLVVGFLGGESTATGDELHLSLAELVEASQ